MEHYVTLFDTLFLPQGLALHLSMERHIKNYKLWILCVDDDTHAVLTKLQLPNVELLQLSTLETPSLLSVKPTRTKGEYCWTLTPFSLRFVFEADQTITRVTYLDADVWFRKPPATIFNEFNHSGKHVLITDHAYSPEHDQSENSGQYCVQFMTFTRDGGESVRKWWEDRCIEWCFARVENGKFGDQKYLDDWPVRFDTKVHVLINKELILAPWNASRFPYGNSIIWHFQGLRLIEDKQSFRVQLSEYSIPETTLYYIYQAYIKDLKQVIGVLLRHGVKIRSQTKKLTWLSRIRYKLSPWHIAIKKINRPAVIKLNY
jgi:hypothetical protein